MNPNFHIKLQTTCAFHNDQKAVLSKSKTMTSKKDTIVRRSMTPDSNEQSTSKMTVLNPLSLFPAKKADTITRGFHEHTIPRCQRELEKLDRWLHIDKIDPQFGIQGDSQEIYIRRSYRRMGSSKIFNQLNPKDASLEELVGPKVSLTEGRKFLLVEESRLGELARYENVLREEKELLGEQCAWLLSEDGVANNPHIPIPATRLAVHNLCESKMRSMAKQLLELGIQWNQYCKQKHYDRPHITAKDGLTPFLKSTPLAQRGLKMLMVRDAESSFKLRMDRDTMSFEDDQSYLVGLYLNAQERRRDYDRYFVLATRYGHYSVDEFYKDNFPGFRYWKNAVQATRMFQELWNRYWSVMKVRRYRAARFMQTLWRSYSAYKQWHPIIRMRLVMGKRTYFRMCWLLWWEYIRLVKRIKAAIEYHVQLVISRKNDCFFGWKKLYTDEKNRKKGILLRFIARIKNGWLIATFQAWRGYSNSIVSCKRRLRRLFGFPHFDVWCEYVEHVKFMKKLYKSAACCQSLVRMFLMRRLYRKKKRYSYKIKLLK